MASFFSSLFGGGSEREAADRNRAALGDYTGSAYGFLNSGLGRSTGAVTSGRDTAGGYLDANNGLWSDYFNRGSAALDSGTGRSLDALNSAGAAYDPLASLGTKYGSATTMLLNSLGVNGASGNQSAVDAFHAGPGYNFTLDQGLQALNRRRAAAGMLDSGNADVDALNYGTGLANQTYSNWQSGLGQFLSPELSATSGAAAGKAGVFGNIANLIGQDTAARLGLLGNATTGQTGVNTQKASNDIALGNTLANLYTGDATNRVGVAGNNLSGNVNANNMQAQGEAQGARNLLGAGQQIASMALSAATGMPIGMGGGGGGGGGGGMGGGSGSNWFSSLGNGSTAGNFGNTFGGGGTLWGNGTGYAVNPWSSVGQFGGR